MGESLGADRGDRQALAPVPRTWVALHLRATLEGHRGNISGKSEQKNGPPERSGGRTLLSLAQVPCF